MPSGVYEFRSGPLRFVGDTACWMRGYGWCANLGEVGTAGRGGGWVADESVFNTSDARYQAQDVGSALPTARAGYR
jgi:hypothetical protein